MLSTSHRLNIISHVLKFKRSLKMVILTSFEIPTLKRYSNLNVLIYKYRIILELH